jgi:hypothetical protein
MRIPAVVSTRSVLRMRFDRKVLRRPEHYEYAREPIATPPPLRGDTIHPCVYPNWDNTPRSGRRGLVITESSPERFRRHVRAAVDSLSHRSPDNRLLFIKSWNEWAEGNYLEPDLDHGHGFLEALAHEIGVSRTKS